MSLNAMEAAGKSAASELGSDWDAGLEKMAELLNSGGGTETPPAKEAPAVDTSNDAEDAPEDETPPEAEQDAGTVDQDTVQVEDGSPTEPPSSRFVKRFNGEDFDLSTPQGFEAFEKSQQAYFTQTRQRDREEAKREVERVAAEKAFIENEKAKLAQDKRNLELLMEKNPELKKEYTALYERDVAKADLAEIKQKFEALERQRKIEEGLKLEQEVFSGFESKLGMPESFSPAKRKHLREIAVSEAESRGVNNIDDLRVIWESHAKDYVDEFRAKKKEVLKKKVDATRNSPASKSTQAAPPSRPKKPEDMTGGKRWSEGGMEYYTQAVLKELGLK